MIPLRARLALDLGMLVLMVLSFAYPVTGNTAHELIGMTVVVLYGAHNGLHRRWYGNLPRGTYRARRGISTAVNLVLLGAALVMTISGLANSRLVETYLGLRFDGLSRQVHSTAAYWVLVAMSAHVGLHTAMIASALGQILRIDPSSPVAAIMFRGVALCIAGFGVFAALDRDIGDKLFAISSFDFWDPTFPAALLFMEYVAIIAVFATTTHVIVSCLKRNT